ncbi:hypothetical protein AB9M75_03865 [Lactobacillus sp. AN1001]
MKNKVIKVIFCLLTVLLAVYYNWGIGAFLVVMGISGLIFAYGDAKDEIEQNKKKNN